MGKLRGILLNPTLRSVIEEVIALPQADVVTSFSHDEATATTDTSCTSPRSNVCSTPAASLARVKQTSHRLSTCMLSVKEARSQLQATCDNYDSGDATADIPLEQISTLKLLLSQSTDEAEAKRLLSILETSIKPTALIYKRNSSVSSTNATNGNFQKRMAYLRQLEEERSYLASTSNIQRLNAHSQSDDTNVKSMMYATSVGLNMIVAPISFGVFMYFFAGSLFTKFFPSSTNTHSNDIDIRQVIAGVVSGVILLFIEMILFVIRSHELDASVRKKSKKRGYKSNPFGYTSRGAVKSYNGEMD